MISMTRNEMWCCNFATEAMQMKGFFAMHAIVHSPRYQTTSRSYWDCSIPTFRELIGYKLEFSTFHQGVHPVLHHNPHPDFLLFIPFLFLPFLVRVFSMHITYMLCLCRNGAHEVNPYDSTINIHVHVMVCPLTILKHNVNSIDFIKNTKEQ